MLVDNLAARGFAQDFACFFRRDRVFELDIDRLGVADEDRNADSGCRELDLRIEHLLGFGHHLPFFLGVAVFHEDIDMRDHVERDALGELLRRNRIGYENSA